MAAAVGAAGFGVVCAGLVCDAAGVIVIAIEATTAAAATTRSEDYNSYTTVFRNVTMRAVIRTADEHD